MESRKSSGGCNNRKSATSNVTSRPSRFNQQVKQHQSTVSRRLNFDICPPVLAHSFHLTGKDSSGGGVERIQPRMMFVPIILPFFGLERSISAPTALRVSKYTDSNLSSNFTINRYWPVTCCSPVHFHPRLAPNGGPRCVVCYEMGRPSRRISVAASIFRFRLALGFIFLAVIIGQAYLSTTALRGREGRESRTFKTYISKHQ